MAEAAQSMRRVNSACDAVDGYSTGIAMCHIAVAIQEQKMSGYGTKRSFGASRTMSA